MYFPKDVVYFLIVFRNVADLDCMQVVLLVEVPPNTSDSITIFSNCLFKHGHIWENFYYFLCPHWDCENSLANRQWELVSVHLSQG